MSKAWKIILVISLATNLILISLLYNKPTVNSDSNLFIKKIDSLESELLFIQEHRDIIEKENDTIYIQLNNDNNEYIKTRDSIIANSSSDDYSFFVRYLEGNKARYDSINNF